MFKLIHKTASRLGANVHCLHRQWVELLKSPFAMWPQLLCTFCSYPLPLWQALWKQAVIVCEKWIDFAYALVLSSLPHLPTEALTWRSDRERQRILLYRQRRGLTLPSRGRNCWAAQPGCCLSQPFPARAHGHQWEKQAPPAQRGMEVNSKRGTAKTHLQPQLSIRKKIRELSELILAAVTSPVCFPRGTETGTHTPHCCALWAMCLGWGALSTAPMDTWHTGVWGPEEVMTALPQSWALILWECFCLQEIN